MRESRTGSEIRKRKHCFASSLIFQLGLFGMAYVLFNRRAHLQRLPVLSALACKRRPTKYWVKMWRFCSKKTEELINFYFILSFYWPRVKGVTVSFSKLFLFPSSDFCGIIFQGWRNMPPNLTLAGANNNELCSPVFSYLGNKDWAKFTIYLQFW